MTYSVEITPRARRDLSRLSPDVTRRVILAMNRLAESGQGDVSRLTDRRPPEYRLRVGDWRVRFARDDKAGIIVILRVLPRGEAYR